MKLNKNSFILILVTSITSCSATYLASSYKFNLTKKEISEKEISALELDESASQSCPYNVSRLSGYRFIRPLLYAEPDCESSEFDGLKSSISSFIERKKADGEIISASFYLREFDEGRWMSVNGKEEFHPGSLMKLPLMITFLKMEEKKPGFLNQTVRYKESGGKVPVQTFTSKEIQAGQTYTIWNLLEYMISYSDNNATGVLHQLVDLEEYRKTYEYIHVTAPSMKDNNYTISALEFSTLLKVLYNSGYLTHEHSEFAVMLLSKSDFGLGLKAGFPKGTEIAEKFGEWADGNSVHELHESGFVYLNGKAYLITVMTRGNNLSKLTSFIASASSILSSSLTRTNSDSAKPD